MRELGLGLEDDLEDVALDDLAGLVGFADVVGVLISENADERRGE